MIFRRNPHRRKGGSWRCLWAILLIAGLGLSACGAALETPAAPTDTRPTLPAASVTPRPTATSEPTPTPAFLIPLDQLKGLQIHFWHPWSGEMSREIDRLVDEFNQGNEWGIHVIVSRSGSSMALAREVDLAAGGEDLPQVVAAPSEQLLTWFERDQRIRALDDLINDPNWGLSEQQRAEISLVFWLQDQTMDLQVGIPAQRSAEVLVYNQTWARELGFDMPPQTTQEFRDQACAAAQALLSDTGADNDGMGGWIINTDGLTVYSWLRAFETDLILEGEQPVFSFNQPQALRAMEFLRSLLDDGCAWQARNPAPQEYFSSRQALIYSANLLDLPVQAGIHAQLGSQDDWIILPFPGDPRPTLVVSGLSYGIMRSEPAYEVAGWLFVRWMSLPDNQARLLEAGGGLPVSVSAASLAGPAMQQIPQWASVVSWIPLAQPVPQSSGWRVARLVLQDAAWQVMQSYVPPGDIGAILAELDATILEVLERER